MDYGNEPQKRHRQGILSVVTMAMARIAIATQHEVDTSQFLPNSEVVTALAQSSIPRAGQAFLLAASIETMLVRQSRAILAFARIFSRFVQI